MPWKETCYLVRRLQASLRAWRKTRCYPLTVTDQVSRYLLKCESIERPDTPHVKAHFERAFREYGLPLRIRSDNGPPFATAGIGGSASCPCGG